MGKLTPLEGITVVSEPMFVALMGQNTVRVEQLLWGNTAYPEWHTVQPESTRGGRFPDALAALVFYAREFEMSFNDGGALFSYNSGVYRLTTSGWGLE